MRQPISSPQLRVSHFFSFFFLVTLSALSLAADRPKAPNLLRNGDFEKPDAAGKLPDGWTTKHAENVKLVDSGDAHGRVVEMTGKADLMSTYGVDLLSDKIPIKANTRYAVTGFTKSKGPNFIVFVKGYATVKRSVDGKPEVLDDAVYQMRKEVHASKDWQPFHLDFDIEPVGYFSDFQHRVQYVRVMLWAYWPAGTGWYDDVRFEEVGPIPEGQRRHTDAVTHTGVAPRLGAKAHEPEKQGFDEEQATLDAVNAFRGGENAKALKLAQQLIAHSPDKASHRVLAARSAGRLQQWDEARRHAEWLLELAPGRELEPHQRDWARVVLAECDLRTGKSAEAKKRLEELSRTATSPHAKAEAQKLLEESGK